MRYRSPSWVLLSLLLVVGYPSWAEPITPLLSPAAWGRLRAQLWRTPADTVRVNILLHLSNDLIGRHEELDVPLDSAAAYAQQAASLSEALAFPTGRIRSLYVLGQLRTLNGPDTLARALLRQGIALSQQQGQAGLEAYGWYYLANSYPRIAQNMPLKLAYYQRASVLFQQAKGRLEYAYLLKTIADMHLLQGHSEQATGELLRVLAIYQAAGHRELHYTYDLLRGASRQVGSYKEALQYSLATIKSAQATHDTASIGGFYARTADIYSELKQNAPALIYYRRALLNAQQTHSGAAVIRRAGSIARLLISEQKPHEALSFLERIAGGAAPADPAVYAQYLAECYVALRQYAAAERCLTQMLSLVERGPADDLNIMHGHQAIGRLYLVMKQYDRARWHLQQALQRSQRTGFLLAVADLHLLLFKADSAQGRFPGAITHYQRYKQLNDSVFNERKNKQLASLEVQYDTRKKEQNIALLTKQTLLQQTNLRQREWQRNAGLAGAGLLLLLLGLVYNRYRLKQRSNQLLQAQQQEINHKKESLERLVSEKQSLLEEKEDLLQEKDWMLKEIHHRVKNNLQVISSLLNTQADYLRDPGVLAALRESQNRVQAMALVHQKLYQSDSLALVNMQEYIQEITERLLESFDCLDSVRELLQVEAIELDIALATPLGLIINESVTNALKHAFPQRRPGTLTIGLHSIGAHRYELLIADDGVGLPPGFDPTHRQSLGLTMVQGLSKQLNGALHITQAGPGVQLTLHFEVARQHVRAKGALA